jgi:hypothetical protein
MDETGPKANRPHMPGYGILSESDGRGLLPWSWAQERLTNSHNYWLATTRPDARPHVMPVWGLWLGGSFYFSTGKQSRKARNLGENSHCVVCTERADEPVIVEGSAKEVADPSLLKPFYHAYRTKYGYDMENFGEPVFALRPRVAFALIEKEMTGSATRWVFEED